MKSLIPIRPTDTDGLSESEQMCLTWFVLSGCKQVDAFKAFVKPELSLSPTTLEKVANQFFSSASAVKYVNDYKNVIDKLLNPTQKKAETNSKTPEQRKLDKERALQSLTDYVIEQALNFENSDDKEDILKFADKLGLLGDEEVKVEAPRRYLPEMCDTCEYKKWIEKNCEIVPEKEQDNQNS